MRMNIHKLSQLRHHHIDSEEKFLNQKERLYHDQPREKQESPNPKTALFIFFWPGYWGYSGCIIFMQGTTGGEFFSWF